MKKLALSCILFALAVAPTFAATKACNSTLQGQAVCPAATGYQLLSYAISTADPDGAGPAVSHVQLVLDAYAQAFNWQATTVCAQDMVAQGTCSAGQLGTLVAESKAQFADRMVRATILATVRQYRQQLAAAAAQAAATAEVDPLVGN